MSSKTLDLQSAGLPADLPRERLPRHVAIIMDGNGRWAERRGMPRIEGHRRGAESVRATLEACGRLGVEQLTLYCLSSENWRRPQEELDFLMHLLEQYMVQQRTALMDNNVVVQIIGRREGIPPHVCRAMDETIRISAGNSGVRLCLAINYGGRTEIVDAVQEIAQRVSRGELDPDRIDEATIAAHLYTAGMPDPDLLIRTAGEMRVSNFLLWQISYAELWVTDRCWPDFREEDLQRAIRDYASRDRKFGGLNR